MVTHARVLGVAVAALAAAACSGKQGPARAQARPVIEDLCELLSRAVDGQVNRFAALRGSDKPAEGEDPQAAVDAKGFGYCAINESPGLPPDFYCDAGVLEPDAARARALALHQQAQACLPDWLASTAESGDDGRRQISHELAMPLDNARRVQAMVILRRGKGHVLLSVNAVEGR